MTFKTNKICYKIAFMTKSGYLNFKFGSPEYKSCMTWLVKQRFVNL